MKNIPLNKLIKGPKQIFNFLYTLFFVGLIIYAIFYIFNAYQSIIYPYQLGFGEGFVLYFAHTLSQGHSIYPDMSTYPFIPGMYPPVYPLVCAGLVKIFGVSFSAGRFVTVLSTILIGILIYIIVREKSNKQIAIIASLLFFASPFIYTFTCYYNVDTLGVLFSLIGIYLVFKYENSRIVYLSIPFFLLSVYTKQSFIAAPIASFIYLFLKDKKLGIKNIILFGASGILLFFLANYLTNGQFYIHIIVYNILPFSIYQAITSYVKTIQIHAILFGFAIAYVLYTISKKEISLFVIYGIISALVAITVGRAGASLNHMIGLIPICCILFGIFLTKLQSQIKKESLTSIFVIVLLIMQLALFVHIPYVQCVGGRTPTAADLNNGQKVSAYVISTNGRILSENAGFAVVNAKELLIEPFMSTQLEKQGLWNQSKFVGDLENKKFSLIILEFDVNGDKIHKSLFTKEMVKAIRNNYYFIEKIGTSYIYMPNKEIIEQNKMNVKSEGICGIVP